MDETEQNGIIHLKIYDTNLEDQDIPAEWLQKIKKTDGTWKKIIMYGTGLSEMLKSGEKLLDKIENVLEYFKGKKNEKVKMQSFSFTDPELMKCIKTESRRP